MSHTMYTVFQGAAQRQTEDPIQALAWASESGPDCRVTARTPGYGPSRIVRTPETARRCVGTLYEEVIEQAARSLKTAIG